MRDLEGATPNTSPAEVARQRARLEALTTSRLRPVVTDGQATVYEVGARG